MKMKGVFQDGFRLLGRCAGQVRPDERAGIGQRGGHGVGADFLVVELFATGCESHRSDHELLPERIPGCAI
jgi:hypothetical protein